MMEENNVYNRNQTRSQRRKEEENEHDIIDMSSTLTAPLRIERENLKAKLEHSNQAKRTRNMHGTITTPYKVGQNTLDNHKTSSARPTKHDINDSRQALPGPSAHAGSSKQRQPPGKRLDMGLPSNNRNHIYNTHSIAGPSNHQNRAIDAPRSNPFHAARVKPEVATPKRLPDESNSEFQIVGHTSNRSRTRSRSPIKPSSSDANKRAMTQKPRSSPSSSPTYHGTRSNKGKGKDLGSDIKPYQPSFSDEDSSSSKSPSGDQTDPITSFDDIHSAEARKRGRSGAKTRPKAHRKDGQEKDDEVEWVESGTTVARGRETGHATQSPESTLATTHPHARNSGLRSSAQMKAKDGTIVQQKTSAKPVNHLKMPSISKIIPSSLPVNQHTATHAEVSKAWFTPDCVISCDNLILNQSSLRVQASIGSGAAFWHIEWDNIKEARICYDESHPLISLTVFKIKPDALSDLEKMRRRFGNLDAISAAPNGYQLRVVLKSQNTSATLLSSLFSRLTISTAKAVRLRKSDCESLRASCNPQTTDNHSPARAQTNHKNRQDGAEVAGQFKDETAARVRTRARRNSSPKVQLESKPKSIGKDKQVEDPRQSKLHFEPRSVTNENTVRRSTRLSSNSRVDLEEEDGPIQAGPSTARSTVLNIDKNELLFAYPPNGRADVNVTCGDALRLEDGEFLNDTLLEFGLRYVLNNLEEERRENVHLFNSFFYDKLSNRSKKAKADEDSWPAYETVKKWSKGKDIFSKRFVVVPINEHFHWYLAVIVNPAGILSSSTLGDSSGNGPATPLPIALEERATSRSASLGPRNADAIARSGQDGQVEVNDDDLNILNSDAEDCESVIHVKASEIAEPSVGDFSITSNDPLDCIGDEEMGRVSVGVQDISIDDDKNDEDRGKPIMTPTMMAVLGQHAHLHAPQPDSEPEEAVVVKKGRVAKPKSDANIVASWGTWILTFDSLGGPHRAVRNTLNQWLQYEAKDKLKHQGEMADAEYWEARVPQQPNFYDCGLYVVHYAKQLLERPEELLNFIQRHPPPSSMADEKEAYDLANRAIWNAEETSNLRQSWLNNMTVLASEYNAAKKAAAALTAKSPKEADDPGTASAMGFGELSSSQDDSVNIIAASQFQKEREADNEEIQVEEVLQTSLPGAYPPSPVAVTTDAPPKQKSDTRPTPPTQPKSQSPMSVDERAQSASPVHQNISNPFAGWATSAESDVAPSRLAAADSVALVIDQEVNIPSAQIAPASSPLTSTSSQIALPSFSAAAPEDLVEQQRIHHVSPGGRRSSSPDKVLKKITAYSPIVASRPPNTRVAVDEGSSPPRRKKEKRNDESGVEEAERMRRMQTALEGVQSLRPAPRPPLKDISATTTEDSPPPDSRDEAGPSELHRASRVEEKLFPTGSQESPEEVLARSAMQDRPQITNGHDQSPFEGFRSLAPRGSSPARPPIPVRETRAMPNNGHQGETEIVDVPDEEDQLDSDSADVTIDVDQENKLNQADEATESVAGTKVKGISDALHPALQNRQNGSTSAASATAEVTQPLINLPETANGNQHQGSGFNTLSGKVQKQLMARAPYGQIVYKGDDRGSTQAQATATVQVQGQIVDDEVEEEEEKEEKEEKDFFKSRPHHSSPVRHTYAKRSRRQSSAKSALSPRSPTVPIASVAHSMPRMRTSNGGGQDALEALAQKRRAVTAPDMKASRNTSARGRGGFGKGRGRSKGRFTNTREDAIDVMSDSDSELASRSSKA